MPNKVEPNIFLVAKTAPDHKEMRNWLDYIGADQFELPPEEAATVGNLLVTLAGKRCYMSYQPNLNPNVSKVRTDLAAFIDNILRVGHGCYDGETEVLTRRGWVSWLYASNDDEYATLNFNGELEWHKPKRMIRYEYSGKMYRVNSSQVDLLVTPDHKMLVCPTTTKQGRKKIWNDYHLVKANQLDETSAAYIKALPSCKSYNPTNFGKLYGFAIGDGSVSGKRLRFHLKKKRKVDYLHSISIANRESEYKYNVIVDNDSLLDLYDINGEKRISDEILYSGDIALLGGVLDGLKNSDGSVNSGDSFSYDTTSYQLAGQVQTLAMMLGYSANISQAECYKNRDNSFGDKPIYRLFITKKTTRPIINKFKDSDAKSEWVEDWEGTVYCAEVPNNTLFVRRNGKAVWSGNSVIEHVNYTFAIENVSRIFTAEFNRHRAGLAVSEGSMRYIRFDELSYWIPDSIRDSDDDSPELREAKIETRKVFNKAFGQMEDNYGKLLEIWDYESLKQFKEKKKLTSLFRRLIGMGVATGGVWTGNLRALRHIFTMRCDPAAEEEICYVASMMLERMIEAEPDVFGDFYKDDEGYWKPRYRKV